MNAKEVGMRKGLFVTLEGSDGSGKTTLAHGLMHRLEAAHIDYVYTREPGGTPISEEIRHLLLDTKNRAMGARCEALLYAASRAQHTDACIVPALEAGKLVLCDRYVLSSLAYQGAGRGLGLEPVAAINRFATDGLTPDVILFLEVDPMRVLQRKAQVQMKDRLEEEGEAFHRRVYEGYRKALPLFANVHRLDADRPADAVVESAWNVIKDAWRE